MSRIEVLNVLNTMVKNMKQIADKHPETSIGSAFREFNTLLRLAKEVYPDSPTVKAMSELTGGVSAADIMMKLSALQAVAEENRAW